MGTAGIAPSHAQLAEWTAREAAALARGDWVQPPDPEDATPPSGPVAREGLRTIPPRETGGNLDIRHLTKGARLFLPVAVEGALFSTGDAHYAQGDSECCITAIEMGATVDVRFTIHKGRAEREGIRMPRYSHPGFRDAAWPAGGGFVATTGYPLDEAGANIGESVTLATRNALLAMIDLLAARGYSREQAYAICSVAADLRISSIVNLPNVVVSALLPDIIFEDAP
jgi:formamidase